jgi:RimJ/RimL family protein N-acetyltransferase
MTPADAGELHRQWNDPGVGRFLWDGEPVSRPRVDEVIASSAASFDARGFGLWTAVLREERRIAGHPGACSSGSACGASAAARRRPGSC